MQVALEYERRPKTAKQYARIRETIEAERLVERFLYLFPNYHLLLLVSRFLAGSTRRIYFGLLDDLKGQALATRVLDSSGVRSFELREALT